MFKPWTRRVLRTGGRDTDWAETTPPRLSSSICAGNAATHESGKPLLQIQDLWVRMWLAVYGPRCRSSVNWERLLLGTSKIRSLKSWDTTNLGTRIVSPTSSEVVFGVRSHHSDEFRNLEVCAVRWNLRLPGNLNHWSCAVCRRVRFTSRIVGAHRVQKGLWQIIAKILLKILRSRDTTSQTVGYSQPSGLGELLISGRYLSIKFGCFRCNQKWRVDDSTSYVVKLYGYLYRDDAVSDPPIGKLLKLLAYWPILERGSARKWIGDDEFVHSSLQRVIMDTRITACVD